MSEETEVNKRKRLFPFGWLPAHWGVDGDTREIMYAEYYYEGPELARKKALIGVTDLLEIRMIDAEHDFTNGKISRYEYKKVVSDLKLEQNLCKLEVEKSKGFISEKDYLSTKAELQANKKIEMLSIDRDEGLMEQHEYEKKVANINDEPWVSVISVELDQENPKAGEFELDWNDRFVSYLADNGYKGASDEDIVNAWFNDVCRTVLLQEAADQDWGMDERKIDINQRTDVEIIRTPPKEKKNVNRNDKENLDN